MHKGLKKGIAVLVAAVLFCGSAPVDIYAANTVTISTRKDFLRFAKNCTLDSWSAGKTVVLTADIDLGRVNFSPIPIFGGTFEGNGHTISGLNLEQNGSQLGLFRYVAEGGVVKNLKVEGNVTPGGSRSSIGGIVGENNGTITGCSFDGTVEGKDTVGGIVGKNKGEVRECSASGEIHGELSVGGIAGENNGFLAECRNEADVNTEYEEKKQELSDIDTDAAAILEKYRISKENTERSNLTYTDIGGVVGFSDGVVQGCDNYGEVGYPHVGYNIGGVAGRQSGYLLGCDNNAAVHGRKDIGGIVGQAEPYLWLNTSADRLDEVRDNLDILHDMANQLLDDTNGLGDDVEVYLNGMSDHSETASDRAREVKNQLQDFADDNIDEINTWTALLSDTMRKLEDPMDGLSDGIEDLGKNMQDLGDAFSPMKKDLPEIDGLEDVEAQVEKMQRTQRQLAQAAQTLLQEQKALRDAIAAGDQEKVREIMQQITATLQQMMGLQQQLLEEQKELARLLADLPDDVKDAADIVQRRLKRTITNAQDALDDVADTTENIADSMRDMSDIISDLANEDPAAFVKLGDDFQESSDALFDSMGDISDDLKGLRESLKSGRQTLTADIRGISDQFQKIMNLLFDEIDDLRDGADKDLDDIFIDVSDEEINRTKQGKIASSHNYGAVEGDRNAGGIAGAMSIDLAIDPEDDIAHPKTLSFTYRMKVILQDCINDGKITGKKDCVGGVVGYAESGTVYRCENYAEAESTTGNYVGGIAGFSEGTIRSSYAKGSMTGGQYVGGIAGKGENVYDSCVIATVDGDEKLGAVLGGAEDTDSLRGNYYAEQDLGAVDGISYAGKAEPISYEAMKEISGIPKRFISFTVSFIADGKTVETEEVPYGMETSRIKLPDIPEKKGSFGTWAAFETDTVQGDIKIECAYTPYVTVVSSMEKNESGKMSLALADGDYTDEAELHIFANAEEAAPVQAKGKTVVYDVILEDRDLSDTEKTTLRLLNEDKEKVSVWQKNGEDWKELDTKNRGKYVVCKIDGTEGTLCISYEGAAKKTLLFVCMAGIAAVVVIFGAVKLKKGRKQKKQTEAEE